MYNAEGEDGPPVLSLFGGDDGDEDDDEEWLQQSTEGDVTDGNDTSTANEVQIERIDESDLQTVMQRIGQHLPQVTAPTAIAELQYRTELITRHMGSLALCRGSRGDALYEAGAVDAALNVLAELNNNDRGVGIGCACDDSSDVNVRLPRILHLNTAKERYDNDNEAIYQSTWTELDEAAVALASACLGAIRDLACGNASNRSAIPEYTITCCGHSSTCANQTKSGVQILSSYIRRYHEMKWEDIVALPNGTDNAAADTGWMTARGRKELRLFTDAAGAIRNASHSTPPTCAELHATSTTKMFIWRLKYGSKERANYGGDGGDNDTRLSLPDASLPWREASFRIAGSLINISEKCPDSAKLCGSDLYLLRLLVEAWGGGSSSKTKQTPASTPMLHLGLAKILHAADDHLNNIGQGGLDDGLRAILDKEEARKRFAQRKEEERKKRIARGLK